ncbi:MAG: DUF2795 domain-containing protein [Pseudonocardiaceae bacterium]|nr:DUF2795 domain-containing protein [Pseudonocardiaceae bacterium]
MTDRDELRVRKALQGMDFPADRDQLLDYATDRSAGQRTVEALRALPAGSYGSVDEVEQAVPQSPESRL